MSADPNKIIETRACCRACGVATVQIHHRDFAAMHVEAWSVEEAAGYLVKRLATALGDAVNPSSRAAVRSALADARAFLDGESYARPSEGRFARDRAREDVRW